MSARPKNGTSLDDVTVSKSASAKNIENMEQSLMKPSSGDEAAKKRKADANTYKAMVKETYHSPHFALLAARDLDAGDSVTDSLAYKVR